MIFIWLFHSCVKRQYEGNTVNDRDTEYFSTMLLRIIEHLSAVDGAVVSIKLEVEVDAPKGIPSNTVRTVSENCRTLKVDEFAFDD